MSKDLASIPLPDLKAKPGNDFQSDASAQAHQVRLIAGSDKQPLACRVWPGSGKLPVAVYLHGIEGHSQWFQNTAQILSQNGIAVYAPDRRGAGLNSKERGHLSSYKALLADIEIILRLVAAENVDQPIILIGNCWGGKPASVLASHDYKSTDGTQLPPITGLILICPAIHTKVDFDWRTKLDIGLSVLRGDRCSRASLDIPLEPAMFTQDPTYLEFIKNDPLRLLMATKKFFFEQFLLTLKAKNAAEKLLLPTLLIESGQDQIVNVAALDQWFAKVKGPDVRKKVFPEAAHSIEFDPSWFDQYCQLLVEWIVARAPGAVA
ncbi:MAG: alpha/beta fold hydrolase [Candidatus Melainabacteria bacterium]|nr:alpha/beta fold hydrolase [Candidatus Melainabacteria bacterium]